MNDSHPEHPESLGLLALSEGLLPEDHLGGRVGPSEHDDRLWRGEELYARRSKPRPEDLPDDVHAGSAESNAVAANQAVRPTGPAPTINAPAAPAAGVDGTLPSAALRQYDKLTATHRGLPSLMLLSSLFGLFERGAREPVMDKELPCKIKGVRIRFSGTPLDQPDLDVLLTLLQMARKGGSEDAEGHRLYFTEKGLLRALDRHTFKSDRDWLFDSICRLKRANLTISTGRLTYSGNLLDKYATDKDKGEYFVVVNREFYALFDLGFTELQWQHRVLLRGKPLALWLHAYYCSHLEERPRPLSVAELRTLCGSKARRLADFRHALKQTLKYVADVTGVITSPEIADDDLVHVTCVLSQKQIDYVNRQKERAKKRAEAASVN